MTNELKILLVDDDKIMLFLHEMFLKKSGVHFDTVLCYNGQEALDYLDGYESQQTTFLILLDINMPVMNGWEFLRNVQERHYIERLVIVMVSSATEETERSKALTFRRVIEYQQKPLTVGLCKKLLDAGELKEFFHDLPFD